MCVVGGVYLCICRVGLFFCGVVVAVCLCVLVLACVHVFMRVSAFVPIIYYRDSAWALITTHGSIPGAFLNLPLLQGQSGAR